MPCRKIIEEEKVAETGACEKTMKLMINLDGPTLLFDLVRLLQSAHDQDGHKFPKLRLEHCGGLWSEKYPKNAEAVYAGAWER